MTPLYRKLAHTEGLLSERIEYIAVMFGELYKSYRHDCSLCTSVNQKRLSESD